MTGNQLCLFVQCLSGLLTNVRRNKKKSNFVLGSEKIKPQKSDCYGYKPFAIPVNVLAFSIILSFSFHSVGNKKKKKQNVLQFRLFQNEQFSPLQPRQPLHSEWWMVAALYFYSSTMIEIFEKFLNVSEKISLFFFSIYRNATSKHFSLCLSANFQLHSTPFHTKWK